MNEHLYGGTRGVEAAPDHIHEDDGTVEGCPGCFPPGDPVRHADVHDHEEYRDGTVAGCPACRLSPRGLPPGDFAWILHVIELVDAHLDDDAPAIYRDNPLANRWRRIAGGPGCEVHEATEELLAVTGGNPRKGVHGSEADVLGELGDTAAAALFAIQSQTKNTTETWQVFLAALAKAESRVPAAADDPGQARYSHPGQARYTSATTTPGEVTAAEWSYLTDALMVFMHKTEELPAGLQWQPGQFAELERLLQRLTKPKTLHTHSNSCGTACAHKPEGREIAMSDPELT
jgi:hypothetical protein